MDRRMLKKAAEINRNRRFSQQWKRVVSLVCALTIFGTSYALIMPAITQQTRAFCGFEEHTHSIENGCYEEKLVLDCGYQAEEEHMHTDACYVEEPALTCGLEETPGHTHTEACFVERQKLNCELAECDAHSHSDACCDGTGVLVCGLEETPGHIHSEKNGCFETVSECVCDLPEEGHTHSDACWGTVRTLRCPFAAGEQEAQEAPAHTHTEECYRTELVLICEREEHEHTKACFSDPSADVETAAVWEKTFRDVRLTGVWADDVLAIAESQLGYTVSSRNYIVKDDGTVKGYTRYGGWYGIPYGDWCAMFCSFCLNYAGVDQKLMPFESGCRRWTEKLQELGRYRSVADYAPKPGDLVFFNWGDDPNPDHVGLVCEVTEMAMKTIEGNNGGSVAYHTYRLADSIIMGYGELPENPDPAAVIDPADRILDCTCGADEGEAHAEDCPLFEAESSEIETESYTVLENGDIRFATLTASGVTVTLTGAQDSFPEELSGIVLMVDELEDEHMTALIEDGLEQDPSSCRRTRLFDIRLMRGGEEIEPLGPVSVAFTGIPARNDDAQVFHVDAEAENTENMNAETADGAIVMDTDHFSVYGVTYTVDFYLGEYVFSIEGGSSITLSALFELLGVERSTSEVVSLSFTDPSLLTCVRTEDDWLLTSLQPFQSEEALTVIFSNEDAILIQVRDAMITIPHTENVNINADGLTAQIRYPDPTSPTDYSTYTTVINPATGLPLAVSSTGAFDQNSYDDIKRGVRASFINLLEYDLDAISSSHGTLPGHIISTSGIPGGFYDYWIWVFGVSLMTSDDSTVRWLGIDPTRLGINPSDSSYYYVHDFKKTCSTAYVSGGFGSGILKTTTYTVPADHNNAQFKFDGYTLYAAPGDTVQFCYELLPIYDGHPDMPVTNHYDPTFAICFSAYKNGTMQYFTPVSTVWNFADYGYPVKYRDQALIKLFSPIRSIDVEQKWDEQKPILSVSKSVDKATAHAGDSLTYTITVKNPENIAANNYHVFDTLPSDVSFVSASPSGSYWNPGGGKQGRQWTVNVAARGTTTITVNARIADSAAPGTYTNTVQASDSTSPKSNDPKATVTTNVVPKLTDFEFIKTDENNAPLQGAKFRLYQCTINGHFHDGTSCTMATVGSEVMSGADGKVAFTSIPEGTYFLAESQVSDPAVYWKPTGYIRVEAASAGSTFTAMPGSGWAHDSLVSSSGSSTRIKNELLTNEVQFWKKDEGGHPIQGAVFRLYKCTNTASGHIHDGTSCIMVSVSEPVTSDVNGYVYMGKIPLGTYYLSELDCPNRYIKPGGYIQVQVAVNESGGVTFTALPGGGWVGAQISGSGASTQIVNYLAKKQLVVYKSVLGGSNTGVFNFEMTLKDANDNQVLLANQNNPGSVPWTVNADGAVCFSLRDKDYALANNLTEKLLILIPIDLHVEIKETSHDGYTTLVKEGSVQLSDTYSVEFVVGEQDKTVTFFNNPGTELPETGGIGTEWFALAGIAALLVGFAYGVCWRHSRRRRTLN